MKITLILAAATASVLMTNAALADDKTASKNACFTTRDWTGWSAPGEGDTLYLKVGRRDVYRIDLAPGSHVHKDFDNYLINQSRGSEFVCKVQDLDLELANRTAGFKTPVFARALKKLTPEEIAAIPPTDRP